ncbi:histidine kinase [Agromyces arachidis]|uniref:histidine kinase n=1 Tax=Agromyces arachidis TaxID=766966 RepID=UPI004056DC20
MSVQERRRRIAIRAAVLIVAVAFSLWMEVAGFLATPVAEQKEVAYVTVHATVPIVFAACAAIAWSIGPNDVPARLMVLFVFLWIPQSIYAVIGDMGWLWPFVRGIDLVWAVVSGLLVLVYPRGWLGDRLDRVIARTAVGASVVNLVAVLALAGPEAVPCDCAPNAYRVADAPVLFAVLDYGYRVVGVGLALLIAGRLLVRWVRGSVPARTIAFLMPISLLAWAVAIAVQATGYITATSTGMVIDTVALLAMAAVPVTFVAGISHTRNMRARVADLMRITREGADRALWAESLARTLRDESVRVFWWDEERGRYVDAAGHLIDSQEEGRGHSILPVASPSGLPIALIRHDKVLTDNMRLLDGVSSALRLSVDNGRLRSDLERTLDQVRQSRQRIVEAGDEARRRIERDLHDGAQQQLVSLGMRLRLAANTARASGQDALAEDLEGAIATLNQGLKELRELAHGIHPSLLSQGGLALAVPELAGRCPVPVEVDVQADGALPELVESTAYFAIAESLANIAKHSQATRAWVRARIEDDEVAIEVRDNGVGGASLDHGSGVLGIADRIEAVGGTLELVSPPGSGTTVTVRMPLHAPATEGAAASGSALLVAVEPVERQADVPGAAGVPAGGIGTPLDG